MAIFEKNKQGYFASLRLCVRHKNYNSYFNLRGARTRSAPATPKY
jgi:hypothetical protein